MRARSALFDVYGGHLRRREGAAPVAALVRLLEPLGFTPAAVRTAVSRMAAQGWLRSVRSPAGAGYALTPRGLRRLDEVAARIYHQRAVAAEWDGRWHVVAIGRATGRDMASSLRLLGYAPIGPATWIAPRPSPGLAEVLRPVRTPVTLMHAAHDGDDAELAARAWDLASLGHRYDEFIAEWEPQVSEVSATDPRAAFTTSQRLLHAWRTFLFADPGLPAALLPAGWQGDKAAEFFDTHTGRLAPAAARFVEECLAGPTRQGDHT